MTAPTYPAAQPHHALISFRAPNRSDKGLLTRLCRAYREADAQPAADELIESALEAAFAGERNVRLWIIELDEKPVGYLAITLGFSIEAGGRDAFLDEIYLDAAVRGRGLGTRALQFVESECAELGVMRLCLEVERHNPAKLLYERVGFRDHQRFLMSKRLTPAG